MLWLYVLGFALGMSLLVFAFAIGVGLRRFGAAIALFVAALIIVGGSVMAGSRIDNGQHGVVIYEAPEMTHVAH